MPFQQGVYIFQILVVYICVGKFYVPFYGVILTENGALVLFLTTLRTLFRLKSIRPEWAWL